MPIEINGLNSQRTQQGTTRQLRKNDRADANDAGPAATPTATDAVTLTDTAARLREIEQDLASQPVVDTERVQAVETSIRNGEYRVEPERVADKIIELEDAMDGRKR